MQTFEPDPEEIAQAELHERLSFLHLRQIAMIDEALQSVGAYGEVRLVVEKGRLRFVITQHSFDALRWHPGRIIQKD